MIDYRIIYIYNVFTFIIFSLCSRDLNIWLTVRGISSLYFPVIHGWLRAYEAEYLSLGSMLNNLDIKDSDSLNE